jgi:methylmalonyl-CoA/ethylmalonyl-CoA epimerase
MVRTIDHIGIAVKNLDERVEFYKNVLGLRFEGFQDLTGRGLRIGVFEAGGVRLELLQPTSADSTVAAFLERRGEGLHHIAFAVDDVREALASVSAAGVKLIDEKPRSGAGGSLIAFLHPDSTGRVLMELCGKKKE